MPSLDIFNNDAFSMTQLTLAMQDLPHQPMLIGSMGLFDERGITTTSMMIERKGTTLNLVPTAARGSPGRNDINDKSKLIPISTVHLPQRGTVLADEVQNVRAFGSETELMAVQTVVNDKLEKLRNNLDVTLEYHRIGAIKGQVLDSDGTTVILDVFNTFGLSQQTHAMALTTDATKVKIKIAEAQRKAEDKLGGLFHTGYVALCGKGFFDSLVGHPAVVAAYDRYLDGAFLRELQRSQNNGAPGFTFCNTVWREYRGSVGGISFIGDDDAYLIPTGIKDMFITRFAPADYMETVNTNGLPYYAKQEPMRMNKGIELETQSNPISLCTRPDAIVKLTKV